MLDFLADSLFDFWLCRGNFGKWLTARLLVIAMCVCLGVAYLSFQNGWYVLGVIGAAGMIYFLILDGKFTNKRIRERTNPPENTKKEK